MVCPADHRHEPRRLFKQAAHLRGFARHVTRAPFHEARPFHDAGLLAGAQGLFETRDVVGMLKDQRDFTPLVQQRCVRGAPVFGGDGAIGIEDVVADVREFIDIACRQDAFERILQLAMAFGQFVAREGVEHPPANQILALPHGDAKIGFVHRDQAQIPIQNDVGVGREVENLPVVDHTDDGFGHATAGVNKLFDLPRLGY